MDDHVFPPAALPTDKGQLLELLIQKMGGEFNVFPLSFAQQQLWLLDQMHPDTPLYHLPAAVSLSGALDLAALARSLNAIMQRHETLRTTFTTVAGQPVQLIASALHAPLPVCDLQALPVARRSSSAQGIAQAAARRPFDLASGPLLRAMVLRLAEAEHILLLMMHHIVADGWSVGVFVRELAAFYESFSTRVPA